MYPLHYVYYALTIDDREREVREIERVNGVAWALAEQEPPKPPHGPLRRGLARVAAGVSLGSASLASALDCDVAADLAEQFPR